MSCIYKKKQEKEKEKKKKKNSISNHLLIDTEIVVTAM
jgi:hypothetical protein